MQAPNIKLAGDIEMPQVGLGLWQVGDRDAFDVSFETAVTTGYRHFDTAQVYGNERFLGEGWRRVGLKREDIFVTTKIQVKAIALGRTSQSFRKSLDSLQTEYVDLALLHFPSVVGRKKAWVELEKMQVAGAARTIGVSNYTVRHLEEMQAYASMMPTVNQVELHVFLQQPELVEYCQLHSIILEAYSPLAHGKKMSDPVIGAIAEKHDKSHAQIMLRWGIEKGFVVLPKSVTPERIKQNIEIFDFELDDDDMQRLSRLDQNFRTCWDPTRIP